MYYVLILHTGPRMETSNIDPLGIRIEAGQNGFNVCPNIVTKHETMAASTSQ